MPFNSFLNYPLSWKPDRQKLIRPIYLSLAKQLERDISQGFLIAGTKLPPQRELADFLDINFTTVTRAYKLCELKGLIYAVAGSGTFVAATASQSVTISSDKKSIIQTASSRTCRLQLSYGHAASQISRHKLDEKSRSECGRRTSRHHFWRTERTYIDFTCLI